MEPNYQNQIPTGERELSSHSGFTLQCEDFPGQNLGTGPISLQSKVRARSKLLLQPYSNSCGFWLDKAVHTQVSSSLRPRIELEMRTTLILERDMDAAKFPASTWAVCLSRQPKQTRTLLTPGCGSQRNDVEFTTDHFASL